ncbi:hypothetical protein EVAR_7664_1 [Eumeta japonica]|uniref:Uncharacterized protein n=1 Tax=Eumeta variegata TaxID=151549 RepID=A0A4C1TKV6_EUMVA|nr:hypothetical protein EVAR_7664_1 [Eumeta japonica]
MWGVPLCLRRPNVFVELIDRALIDASSKFGRSKEFPLKRLRERLAISPGAHPPGTSAEDEVVLRATICAGRGPPSRPAAPPLSDPTHRRSYRFLVYKTTRFGARERGGGARRGPANDLIKINDDSDSRPSSSRYFHNVMGEGSRITSLILLIRFGKGGIETFGRGGWPGRGAAGVSEGGRCGRNNTRQCPSDGRVTSGGAPTLAIFSPCTAAPRTPRAAPPTPVAMHSDTCLNSDTFRSDTLIT